MKNSVNYFDAIYLINLEKNKERLIGSLMQLAKYKITAKVFEATYNECGAIGLRDSMIRLFKECLEKKFSTVLVFEDDIDILLDINHYLPLCLEQLPDNYDLLYLGAYIIKPFKERYSANLLRLNGALTTHAICYPKKTIEKLLPLFENQSSNPKDKTPIDMVILNKIISQGNSFITYPLLVSQVSGFSDIEGKEINYEKYIEKEYNKLIKIQSYDSR